MRQCLENGTRYVQSYLLLKTNTMLHIRYPLEPVYSFVVYMISCSWWKARSVCHS